MPRSTYKLTLVTALAVVVTIVINAFSGGPATVGVTDMTGRTGSNCGACHSGGNYSPQAVIQLEDQQGDPVSAYVPGTTYTLRITGNATVGNPAGFGGQAVAVLASNSNANAGNLSAVSSANTQIASLGGRQYLEHSGINSAGIFEAQWTAPSTGSGNVNFFATLIAANGNGSTSGDQHVSVTLSLAELVCNAFQANASITQVSVNGGNNGSISLNPSGGTSPYSYQWSNGQTTANISGLSAGNYTVTVTDANGCTDQFSFSITQPAPVTDGVFDNTFAGNGASSYQFHSGFHGVSETAILNESLVYILSESNILAVDTNGMVDSTFGLNGVLSINDFFADEISVYNQRMALGGVNGLNQQVLAMYDLQGDIDSSFGNQGQVVITGNHFVNDVAFDFQGRLLFAGSTGSSPNSEWFIGRINTNGTLDSTFGINGLATLSPSSSNDEVIRIRPLQNGKIILAGESFNVDNLASIARLNTNGSLDQTFGNAGYFTRAISNRDTYVNNVFIAPNGEIYLAGNYDNVTAFNWYVLKTSANGVADASFGSNGLITSTALRFANDVALQPNGKVIVGGVRFVFATKENFAVLRLNSNGTADSTWAGTSEFYHDFNALADNLRRLHVLPSGSVLGFGSATISSGITAVGAIKLGNTDVCPFDITTTSTQICNGDTFLFNGRPLFTAGFFSDTVTNVAGCDSVLRLFVGIQPTPVFSVILQEEDYCQAVNVVVNQPNPVWQYQINGNAGAQYTLPNAAESQTIAVSATDANGCSSELNLNYDATQQLSAYTLIAQNNLRLGKNNEVMNGSIGVVNNAGLLSMQHRSSLTDTNAFAVAPSANITTTALPQQWIQATVSSALLPAAAPVNINNNQWPTITVGRGVTRVIKADSVNLIIRPFANVTIQSKVLGDVQIMKGAQVSFERNNVLMASLQVENNGIGLPTTLSSATAANWRIEDGLRIDRNTQLNIQSNALKLYLGNGQNTPLALINSGRNTTLNAKLINLNGDVRFNGTNGNGTVWNGQIVAQNIQGNAPRIKFNWTDCPANVARIPNDEIPITAAENVENLVQDLPLKVDYTEFENQILIYPNPTEDRLFIQSNSPIKGVQVYQLSGAEMPVLWQSVSPNKWTCNTQHWAAGMYLIKVWSDGKPTMMRLVKR